MILEFASILKCFATAGAAAAPHICPVLSTNPQQRVDDPQTPRHRHHAPRAFQTAAQATNNNRRRTGRRRTCNNKRQLLSMLLQIQQQQQQRNRTS